MFIGCTLPRRSEYFSGHSLEILSAHEDRHLISQESGPYVDLPTAHQKMSLHCLRYLQFFSLRPESTDDEIKADILRGEYLWLEYVESNWLDHIRSGSKVDSVKLNELIHYLRQFLARWQKDASHDYNSSNMPLTFSLDTFRDCSPDVYRKLVRVALHQSQGHISSNHPGEPTVPPLSADFPFNTCQILWFSGISLHASGSNSTI